MKYNWNITIIIKRLEELNERYKQESDPEILKLIQLDMKMLNEHIFEFYSEKFVFLGHSTLLERFMAFKDDTDGLDYLIPHFLDFEFYTTDFNPKDLTLRNTSLSRDAIVSLTHDFYKSFDGYFFRKFMQHFSKRRDHIIFYPTSNTSKNVGNCVLLSSLNEAFIEVYRRNTLEDVLTTIHEYGHATTLSINPYHFVYAKNLYREIDTMFLEMVACDFLKDTLGDNYNPSILKAYELVIRRLNSQNIVNLYNLKRLEEMRKSSFKTNKVMKQLALKELKLPGDTVEDLIENYSSYSLIYLTSYMFAIELYMLYLEDKEKAIYYLKKIIQLRDLSEDGYYHEIINLGINPNEHLTEFKRVLTKDLNNL